MPAAIVDCHSHVLFGVDDGARTLDQAVAMLNEAHAAGTRILFATPHVAPPYKGWTGSAHRLARIRRRFAELQAHVPAGLDLRLGFEITPVPQRLRRDDDPARFVLPGTEVVLIDGPQAVPWVGDASMERYVRRIRAEGLTPVLAHPERRAAWPGPHDPHFAERMRAAGALLQVDASGLSGADGPGTADEARRLLGEGLVDLIASDGHGSPGSPVRLDEAMRAAADVVGDRAAARLVDGSALRASAISERGQTPFGHG